VWRSSEAVTDRPLTRPPPRSRLFHRVKSEDHEGGDVLSGRRRTYTVASVARACDIIGIFAVTTEVLPLGVVAERAHLNKVTAFRILQTLVENGLIERSGRYGYRSRVQSLPTRRFRIGYASQSRVVPFTATVTDSLITAAAAAGVDLLVLNNEFSARTAFRNAERLVAEKVDLAIESQIQLKIAAPLATMFVQAGIPLIAIDIPHPGGIYFGGDNYKAGLIAGRYLGRWAIRNWQGVAEQILFVGAAAAETALQARLTGMYDGLIETHPEFRHVPVFPYDTEGQFEPTLETIRKHLRRNPSSRTLVGTVNDVSALAALQAFRDYGAEQHCAIAGQDAVIEARQEIRRPSTRLVCTVAYFPETYGAGLIRLALDILKKKPVPPAVFTEHALITPENVDKVYPYDSWTGQGTLRS
jgi:ribose transport system substrate-binding protein